MNIQQFQAEQTVSAAKMVAHWVEKTDPDRLAWQPKAEDAASDTRSILDQIGECIGVNYMMAGALRGDAPAEGSSDRPAPAECAQACRDLVASAEALASVISDLDDSALARTYQLPWGPMPGMFLITMPASNMVYHGGQINYLQRLYGDTQFYFPESM